MQNAYVNYEGRCALQPISQELLDNVARTLRRLMPTIELIKYSFVAHHQHGRRVSQE